MRVLFDGFWWVQGPGANRTVMREVINAWQRAFPRDEILLAVRSIHFDEAKLELGDTTIVRTRLWPQALSNAFELPVLARKHRADIVIAHNYAAAWGKNVVFVHDLLFSDHPEWFSLTERRYFGLMPLSLRRATEVVTSSVTEAKRIERVAPWVGNVTAVGLTVSTTLTDGKAVEPVGCPPPFGLVVGRLNVRKNLATAISAARISNELSPSCPMLVVGSELHSGVSGVPEDCTDLVADGTVRFLGHVTDENLRWLYENASVTIYLSLDEGFGLPPVEAAHFRSPLVVSDIPIFRETVGLVARFVDPLDRIAVAKAVDEAIRCGPSNTTAGSSISCSWTTVATRMRDAAKKALP